MLRRVLHQLPGALGAEHLAGFDEAVAATAARHGLLAAIAAARAPGVRLDRSTEALLRRAGVGTGFQAERVRRVWEIVLDTLEAAGVPVLPLKGRSLALRLYGSASVRFSSDVDVLVQRADLDAALAALQRVGFRVPDWVSIEWYRRHHHHLFLSGPAGQPPVELHFGLLSEVGGELDGDAAFARAEEVQVGGRTVRVMRPEDEFVYLVAHAAAHGFCPMSQLLDLKLLAARGLDAELVRRRAEEGRVSVALSVGASLARDWTGLELPGVARRDLRSRAARPFFSEPLMLEAVHCQHRRYTTWATSFILTDRFDQASSRLLRNASRGARRKAKRRLGARLPASWAD